MKIVVISASTRAQSESLKVATFIEGSLKKLNQEVNIIDLYALQLPLFDDTWSGEWLERWQNIDSLLRDSDGLVFVLPEWNGTAGAGIINLLLYIDKHQIAHKPAMLVGVSSGRGGAYPLLDMRLVGYKNTRYVVIPESLIISRVKEAFVDGELVEEPLRQRAEYGLKMLLSYAEALQNVRNSPDLDFETFSSGV